MGSTSWKGAALESSNTIHVGRMELLLLSEISTRQLPTSIQKNLGLHITFDETAATETSNVDVNPSAPSNKYVLPTFLHGNVSHTSKKIARPL